MRSRRGSPFSATNSPPAPVSTWWNGNGDMNRSVECGLHAIMYANVGGGEVEMQSNSHFGEICGRAHTRAYAHEHKHTRTLVRIHKQTHIPVHIFLPKHTAHTAPVGDLISEFIKSKFPDCTAAGYTISCTCNASTRSAARITLEARARPRTAVEIKVENPPWRMREKPSPNMLSAAACA